MQIGTSLVRNARRHPDRVAVVFAEQQVTYAELLDRATRVAHALQDAGIARGGHVGILARNCPDYLAVCLGAGMAGMVASQLNYRLTAHDWVGISTRGDLELLVVAEDLLAAAPELGEVVPRVWRLGAELDDVLAQASDAPVDEESFCSTLMMNTSGTTGLPKGVLRSRHGFFERSLELGLTPDEVYLGALPLCLSAGIMYGLTTLVLGGTVVLMEEYEPGEAIDLVARHGCTSTMLVPTMLDRFVRAQQQAGPPHGTLRRIIGGAGEVSAELKQTCHDVFGPILSAYAGSSEAGQYANLRPHEMLDRLEGGNCVGRPALGVEIRLTDESGAPVPIGEIGEIWVRSDAQYDGYYGGEQTTADTVRDGFVSVGDLGRFDAEGYLWFLGRARDVIKSGGINVYAVEVEAAVATHPSVVEVAVVATPDPQWSEKVTAVVVLREGAELSTESLRAWTRETLAGFKQPRALCVVDALPRNLTGRVLKEQVREMAEACLTSAAQS